MELSKVSTPQKSELQFWCHPGSIIVSNWVELNLSWNKKCIECFLRNINQPGFHGPVKFSISLIILTISGGYIKCFVIDNLYIVQTTSLRCFSRILPQLTQSVNFEISSTVPICCIPCSYKRTLSPVEQKKVRIRHKLLYVKYTKPSCFEDFTPSVWPSWKAAINQTVRWTQ